MSKKKLDGSVLTKNIICFMIVLLMITLPFNTYVGSGVEGELDKEEKIDISSSGDESLETNTDINEGLAINFVDDSLDVGKHTSLTVEYDEIYISYYSEHEEALKLAKSGLEGQDWYTWTIDDEGVGKYSSLEVDAEGSIHIAYYDEEKENLKYTIVYIEEDNSMMKIEEENVVDEDGNVGKYASLELCGQNMPHISYHDETSGALKYAERDNEGDWITKIIEDKNERTGRYTSIALDSNSSPHISFYDWEERSLKYTARSAGDWESIKIEEIEQHAGKYTSLELDEDNNAHISFYAWTEDSYNLYYVRESIEDEGWSSEKVSEIDPAGTYTSLELTEENRPVISYHEWGEENLRVAWNDGKAWNIDEIDMDHRVGKYSSLDYIGQGEVHISYYDEHGANLRHARVFLHNRTPLAPQSVSTYSEYGDIILKWEPPIFDGILGGSGHIDNYLIYRSTLDMEEWIEVGNVTENTFTDEIDGEDEKEIYEYKIRAVNKVGVGDASTSIKTTALYFDYEMEENSLTNNYEVREDLDKILGDSLEFYSIKWDYDHNESKDENDWSREFTAEERYYTHTYEEVGLKSVLFVIEDSEGIKRSSYQSAWVLGEFELTSTYEKEGSEEIFFSLPEESDSDFPDVVDQERLKNTYVLKGPSHLPYEEIKFEFLDSSEKIEATEDEKGSWRKTFSVSDAEESTEILAEPVFYNELRERNETPINRTKPVDIIETPEWFPYLLCVAFGDHLEIENEEKDGDYVGWNVDLEIPETDKISDEFDPLNISSVLENDIIDDLDRFFGGDYGFEIEMYPDRDISFSNGPDLELETTIFRLETGVDEDDMGIGDMEGEFGNTLDWAAETEMEFTASIEVCLYINQDEIGVTGSFGLNFGAGIDIDVPLKSIGIAEVGLTAGVEGEVELDFEVGSLSWHRDEGLSPSPTTGQVPVELGVEFGGGPYGSAGADLARIEGNLILDVGVGVDIPSMDRSLEHSGRFEVVAEALWGLWEKSRSWELYSSSTNFNILEEDMKEHHSNEFFSIERLATRDYSYDFELVNQNEESFGIVENVGSRSNPDIRSLNESYAAAVWSELELNSEGEIESNLYLREYEDDKWTEVIQVQIDQKQSSMKYNPQIVPHPESEEMIILFKEIDENINKSIPEDDFYEKGSIRGNIWCPEEGEFEELDIDYNVEGKAIQHFDAVAQDDGKISVVYRAADSNWDILEGYSPNEGRIGVLEKENGDGWKNSTIASEIKLPQTTRPSIETIEGDTAVIYTTTEEFENDEHPESDYNKTLIQFLGGKEHVITETPNTTTEQVLSKEDGKFVVSWVENHTEIRRKVVERDEQWSVPEHHSIVYAGSSVSSLTHQENKTGSYYAFQTGENHHPKIMEKVGDENFGRSRQIRTSGRYSQGELNLDLDMPRTILVEEEDIIESWHVAHHRFNDPFRDQEVDDESEKSNRAELIGEPERKFHSDLNEYQRYGSYANFQDHEQMMVINHSKSLNVTEKSEEFSLTSLLKLEQPSDGYLFRKENSWAVMHENSDIFIELWDEDDKKHMLGLDDVSIQYGVWSFFALRYEDGHLNITMKPLEGQSSIESYTEHIEVEDIEGLTSSSSDILIAEYPREISIDDFRLVENYLPDASLEKIKRTEYPRFDPEYSVTTEKIPPYVNFTYDSQRVTLSENVTFVGQSPETDLNWTWIFEDGTEFYGKEIEYRFQNTGYKEVKLLAEHVETGVKTEYSKTIHVIDVNPPRFSGFKDYETYSENNSVKLEWFDAVGESEPFEYRVHHLQNIEESDEIDFNIWRKSTDKTSVFIEDLDPTAEHTFALSVKNSVGLVNESSEYKTIDISDTVPPKFEGLESATTINHEDKIVRLNWDEAEDHSKPIKYHVYHSHEGGLEFDKSITSVIGETTIEIPVSNTGYHHFAVRAEDSSGNIEVNEVVRSTEVMDIYPPHVEITNLEEGDHLITPHTIEWSCRTENSDIEGFLIQLDGQIWITEDLLSEDTTYFDLTGIPEGERILTVRAIDEYGNFAEDEVSIEVYSSISPEVELIGPDHGSVITETEVDLQVDITDPLENGLNITYYGEDDQKIGEIKNITSEEESSIRWQGLEKDKTYGWYVVVDNGVEKTESRTWEFTISSEEELTRPENIYPSTGSIINETSVTLTTEIDLEYAIPENISFYNAQDDESDESKLIETKEDFDSSRVSVKWEDRKPGETYRWYVVSQYEDKTSKSEIWNFTVKDTSSSICRPRNPYPKDGEVDVSLNTTLSAEVYHDDDRDVNVSFYMGEARSHIGCDYLVKNGSRAEIEINELEKNTTYTWFVEVTDEDENLTSKTWSFSTLGEYDDDDEDDEDGTEGDVGEGDDKSPEDTDEENGLYSWDWLTPVRLLLLVVLGIFVALLIYYQKEEFKS